MPHLFLKTGILHLIWIIINCQLFFSNINFYIPVSRLKIKSCNLKMRKLDTLLYNWKFRRSQLNNCEHVLISCVSGISIYLNCNVYIHQLENAVSKRSPVYSLIAVLSFQFLDALITQLHYGIKGKTSAFRRRRLKSCPLTQRISLQSSLGVV